MTGAIAAKTVSLDSSAPVPIDRAAELFFPFGGIKTATLLAAIRKGSLAYEKVGRAYFVTQNDIEEWRKSCRAMPNGHGSISGSAKAVNPSGDGPDEESTGCGKDDVEGAAHALQEYLTKRFTPNTGQRDLAQISIPEVLTMYAQGFAVNHAAPELVGYHMGPLLDFWGEKSLADVKGATCRSYVEWRTRQVGRHKKPVSAGTARRELETLQAAINRWHKESPLTAVPSITLPPKAHRRERFLERWEAARLLASALGYRPAALDIHTREPNLCHRLASRQMHIARFILIGLDTGTRHSAILGLQWLSSIKGGHADLDRGLLYRRGARERDTTKRRPPVAISASLRSHMRRWFRSDSAKGIAQIVHWHGKPIKKERRAWGECVEGASLGPDITPHVLRHTCATWALWNGKSIWEVAERLGTSAAMIDRVYGHHWNATISGAKLGPGKNAANLSH